MTDPSESSEPGEARFRLSVIIALAIVIALGALLAWWLKPPEPPAAKPAAAPPPSSAAPPSTPSPPGPAPPERPRRREAKSEHPPDSAPTAAPQPPPKPRVLRVTSDVAGAFVFVDRKFLGKPRSRPATSPPELTTCKSPPKGMMESRGLSRSQTPVPPT